MRKLLQNKTVVSSLCAVAVLSAAGNFVPLSARRFIQAAARPVAGAAAAEEPEVLTVPALPKICAELGEWRDLFPIGAARRDPFAPTWATRTTSPSAATAPPVVPVFSLQAISIEPGRAFAVVNQTVVSPGEQLGDYRVERITAREVRLVGPAGTFVLAVGEQSANPHKAP